MTFNIYVASRVVFAAHFPLPSQYEDKENQHKSLSIPSSVPLFRCRLSEASFTTYWFNRVKIIMMKRSFVLDTKVANLSRTSDSQSIYSDTTCLQPPFLCQNPIYPHISSSSNFVSPKKKIIKRIFIRFSLLCSFLIKDSSADSITCCLSHLAVEKLERFRSGKHTNWISAGNWRCHCFYTVAAEGRKKFLKCFQVWDISARKANYSRPRKTKLYIGWLEGDAMNISSALS